MLLYPYLDLTQQEFQIYHLEKKSGLKISFHVLGKSKSQVYSVKVNFTAKPTESEITQQHKTKYKNIRLLRSLLHS